jgi:hypothetical protein
MTLFSTHGSCCGCFAELNAGVYLKANKEAVAAHGLPPLEHDPGTRFVERQLAAVPADPGAAYDTCACARLMLCRAIAAVILERWPLYLQTHICAHVSACCGVLHR